MTDEPPFSLDALQHWMQNVIMHPGGVVAGAESADVRIAIDRVVNPSRALSAARRLDIYNRSYFARLLECMRAEYSVLAAALGDELFDSFALGYLEHHPSQSYTLGRLGDRFPEYLTATRPHAEAADGSADDHAGRILNRSATNDHRSPDRLGVRPAEEEADWPEFLIDLARLERTINVVFDGPGAEGVELLDHARLAAMPADRWPDARLECVPCLRLLTLSYPINDYFTAVRRGESPDFPERSTGYLAVTRRDYRVYRYPLGAAQFHLLAALLDGETVGTAIARAADHSTTPDGQLAQDLREWFFTWTAAGFFRDVR